VLTYDAVFDEVIELGIAALVIKRRWVVGYRLGRTDVKAGAARAAVLAKRLRRFKGRVGKY
jgi:hypothetical protein